MIKRVGYAIYAHKSNIFELLQEIENSEDVYRVVRICADFKLNYDIIKYDKSTHNVSLIECPTWDILNEPIVGDSYCFSNNYCFVNTTQYKKIKGGTKVYHNKWQFVSEDYKGFDIEEAKERTKLWNSIPNIKSMKSKIGNVDFWYALLLKNGIEI